MRLAVIVSFVAALGAAPLFAADAPPGQGGWQRPTPQQMEAHRAEMEAKRSADIALLLGLRADQKPALDAFLATMRPHGPHGGPGRDHKPGEMPPQNEGTLASLDRMSQHIDARDAEAKQRIEATRRFYASLTPEQQQRADAMMRLMHDHGGHGDHGGMHHPHGPMGGPGGHGPDDRGPGAPPPPPMGG